MEKDENYQKYKENLIRLKSQAEERLQQAIDEYNKDRELVEASSMSDDKKARRLQARLNIISTKKRALNNLSNQLEFVRPSTEEDKIYRLRQYDEFPQKIGNVVQDDLPLRFHGCSIYAARDIIHSGEISSSVDRLGIETSYDVEGQVSVTTKQTIETTIRGYTDLVGNYDMPAGCVFVLLPKDEYDAKAGEKSMLMQNVSFKDEPDRLVSIITTPENIDKVTDWSQECGIDVSKIYDFDGFIKSIEKNELIKVTSNDFYNQLVSASKKLTESQIEQVTQGLINAYDLRYKEGEKGEEIK